MQTMTDSTDHGFNALRVVAQVILDRTTELEHRHLLGTVSDDEFRAAADELLGVQQVVTLLGRQAHGAEVVDLEEQIRRIVAR